MSNRIPHRGDFTVADGLLDDAEWSSDLFIDSIGSNCKVVYPAVDSECYNCKIDPITGRSADIYKTGGPIPFPNFTICPVCQSQGRLTSESTETIKLRVYWDSRHWIQTESFVTGDGYGQIIGYMTDVVKLRRAKEILLYSDMRDVTEIRCRLAGEIVPYGFRKNRYFLAFVKRL